MAIFCLFSYLLFAMQVDDIISYADLVSEEKVNLQKGMNFGIKKGYSILLMSTRKGAPYADEFEKKPAF